MIMLQRFSSFGLIALAALLPGCGKSASPAQKAEIAIDRFLDSWARGEAPDTIARAMPPIQGTDPDWQAGHRLRSFLNVDTKAKGDGANLVRCKVALALQDRQGKKWERDVEYDVLLDDPIVISRATK